MSNTNLDLALELWKSHGIFALGWIFCIPMGVYIVLLHKRNNTIYKEYIKAISAANAAVVPLLEKAVAAMTQVIVVVDSAADSASNRDSRLDQLHHVIGESTAKLDIVIQTFIGERYYTEKAIDAGADRGAVKAGPVKKSLRRNKPASTGGGNSAE